MSNQSDSSLPSEIYLLKMIESRKLEVKSLNNECKRKCAKLWTQRLPPYMRRRAASHNPKRVPKSVRCALKQTNTNINAKKHKKYKNKKKLEMSVKRRFDKTDRTVLHNWFAKRFRLEKQWNHLLPVFNRTKNQRILYRNAKNDVIFFDLSHIRCIQIDYSNTTKQNLVHFLSHFTNHEIGYGFGAIDCLNGKCEGITVLFKYDSYPLDVVCDCSFVWHQTIDVLSLSIHISVYDYVFHQLIADSQKYFPDLKLSFIKSDIQRFRLIGPKSYDILSKCFNSSVEIFQKTEENMRFISYFNFNINTSLLTISNAKSFEEKNNLMPTDGKVNELEFKIVNNNNVLNKRSTIDVITGKCSAKYMWNKLTRNRAHKVGGLRDIKMIALNTSSILFPYIGFSDTDINREILKYLQNDNNTDKPFYVIRNALIIASLAKGLNSLTFSKLSNEPTNSLINVELICLNRGVPDQFDHIMMPNEDDIKHINDQTVRNTNFERVNRKLIGLIEFGTYSLEVSRGKAIGVIITRDLQLLINFNEQKNNSKQIYAMVKSDKSSNYYAVSVNVLNINTLF